MNALLFVPWLLLFVLPVLAVCAVLLVLVIPVDCLLRLRARWVRR